MKNLLTFILCLLSMLLFGQIKYSEINLEVDFAGAPKTYENYWNRTGFSPGDLLLRKDMQLTLDYLSAVPNQGVRYIRIHWLLNMVGSKKTGTSKREFNFNKLDTALDMLVSRGLKPVFEIMGFPSMNWNVTENKYDKNAQAQLNEVKQWIPDFNVRKGYLEWYDFIKVLVHHLEQRYGAEELKTWYFESTNEPEHKHFWKQGIPALLNYWDATSEAIKSVNSDYKTGGPGSTMGLSESFKAFLSHCDTGRNVITGRKGAPLDFITVHRKARPYIMVDMEKEIYNYIREHHPRFTTIPFGNDEADPMVGWNRPFWWRADAWYGACIVSSVDAHNRLLIDSLGVNYHILSNDNGFMGDWYRRTHLASFINPSNKDHFWLFKQPDLSAMTLLSLCTGKRYDVKGYQSTRENTIVIPVKTKNGEIAILIANKPEFGDLGKRRQPSQIHITPEQNKLLASQGAIVNINLKNLGLKNFNYTHIRIDNRNGNAFTEWTALGQPDTISLDQYKMMAANMEPVILESRKMESISNLRLTMPSASISLVILSHGKKEELNAPEILFIHRYYGYNSEKADFVKWQQSTDQITTYDLFASYNGSDFIKVNPQPLFDCGFLNVLPDTVDKADYKVVVKSLK